MNNQTFSIKFKSVTSLVFKPLCLVLALLILGFILATSFSMVNVYDLLSIDFTLLKTWWFIMLSFSLLIISVSHKTQWQKSGFFFALLLLSISSQLSFTEPKWFQLITLNTSNKFNVLCLVILCIQFATSSFILFQKKNRKLICIHLRVLGYWKLFLFTGVTLVFSVTAMLHIGNHDPFSLLKQLAYSSTFIFLNFANIFVLLKLLPDVPLKKFAKKVSLQLTLYGPRECSRGLDKLLPYVVSIWVFFVSSLLSIYAFERLPHVEDEVASLFQAKYFLKGLLAVPTPAIPEAFEFYLLNVVEDRWFSITPPGWPMFLALGVSVDAAWLVNPAMAAVGILLAHALLLHTCNRSTANIAILLMAISPWFLATSASLMNHTITFTFMLATWVCLYRAKKSKSVKFAFLAGLCAGVIFLTRHLDGVIVGVLTGLWSLHMLGRPKGLSMISAYGIGCIIIGGVIFPYNWHFTGDPMLTTVNAYINDLWYPGANSLGFGPDIGPPKLWGKLDLYSGHSFLEAIVQLQHNGYMLSFDLFGWGIGSLCLLLVHGIWGVWRPFEKYMLIVTLTIITAYSMYWFGGGFYIGPRYWFILFFPLVVISTAGLSTLIKLLTFDRSNTLAAPKVGLTFIILSIITIIAFIPWRGATRYHEYRNYHSDFRDIVNSNDLQNSLVFIKNASESDFGSAFFLNDPTFSGNGPIFAYDRGPRVNLSLAKKFPQRSIYYAQGRSKSIMRAKLTGGPFELGSFHK